MRCNRVRSQAGFTLIELLVAISILAIVAVLGWRGLDSIVRSREALTSELEQTRGLQLTFAQLQSDCANTVNPLNYPNLPQQRATWIDPQRLVLIRNVFLDGQAPAMQVVSYRVKSGTLVRFESVATRDLLMLNQLVSQAFSPPQDEVDVAMQTKVQSIEFSGWPQASGATGKVDLLAPLPINNGSSNSTNNSAISGIQNVNAASTTSGLQVSLQLVNHPNTMIKIFIIGGA